MGECMSQLRTRLIAATGALFFVSCASLTTSQNSFDSDSDRVPASVKPPLITSPEGQSLDPVFLQSQADYNYSMGEAFSMDGSSQKAIEYFKTTLVYDPKATSVKLRLATEQLRAGQVSEALDLTQQVVKEEPSNEQGRMLLAALFSSMKLYPKAIDQYSAVLAKNPNHVEASLFLGAIYAEIQQYDKAIKHFENLIKRSEEEQLHTIHYYLARVYLEKKAPQSNKWVEHHLKKAVEIKPTFVEALLTLGAFYTSQDQEKKAMQLYEDYQKKYGPSVKLAEVLAQNYLEREDYDSAYEQLEILESQGEDSLNVKLKMALILVEKKMYDRSVVKLKEILKEVPESDRARFYLAAIYEQTKQVDRAVAEYRRVPAESHYFKDSVIHGAYLLKNEKRIEESIAFVEEALKKKKDEPAFYSLYASLLNDGKKSEKAVSVLEEAKDKFPQNTQVLFYLGTIYDSLGEKDLVISTMKSILERDPMHAQALNYVAYTFAEVGKNLEEAEGYARRAAALEPKDGYILDTLGWVLFKQGKISEAIKYLEAAHAVAPHVPVIAEHLGDVYVKQAMIEKAKKMYKRAMENETESAKVDKIRIKISSIEVDSSRVPAAAP